MSHEWLRLSALARRSLGEVGSVCGYAWRRFPRFSSSVNCYVLALIVALAGPWGWPPAGAQVGKEFGDLERSVSSHPDDPEARRTLAEAYAQRGFIEEAVAQYLALLSRDANDADAGERIKALVAERMPSWLPAEVEQAPPFPLQVFELSLADPARAGAEVPHRLLVTQAGLPAGEGCRTDRLHKWAFPSVEYGYAWDPKAERWVMKGRAHWARPDDRDLAQSALKAFLALWCVGSEYLRRDPTRPWGQPIDLWLTERGEPGARAVGRDVYLYATNTPRPPEEWWRELAHEYGHVALPGIGGFTDTDDPWADGELGELLFTKWLAAGKSPERLPWSVEAAEKIAAARRQVLIAGAAGPVDTTRLNGTDEKAKDYFLGLALRVEAAAGPRFLGEALAKCPRGSGARFVAAVQKLARERAVDPWQNER